MKYNNLDRTESFSRLRSIGKPDIKRDLTRGKIEQLKISIGGGLSFNYAALPVNTEILETLQELSDEQELIPKYREILNGEIMNTGEKRMVLHHLTRGRVLEKAENSIVKEKETFYSKELEKIFDFASKVHNGVITGSTGKKFTTVVQIGIGGSDLGPRALYIALENYARSRNSLFMNAEFISNVDPDDAASVMEKIDIETSLFILVSKSGTTQETLTNRKLAISLMEKRNIPEFDPGKHMIAVTSSSSPLASSKDYLASFFIDDFIGGRYSSTSAVGGTVLTLSFGKEIFTGVLMGAHEADIKALEPDIIKNAPLFDALIGIYMRNILGYPSTAILPYSQALSRFPAHLQQLDMESNGKSVNRFGEPVTYKTGPVIFGEPGTNGQHSFYQLLHQGTDIIPLQFIGFLSSQTGIDTDWEGSTSQSKLKANLAAQIVAFAKGRNSTEGSKNFKGGRPSSLIYGKQLTPEALGALLAHFENKVMFQGLAWNINSFDQEGVQLGKILTKELLSGRTADDELKAFASLLKV